MAVGDGHFKVAQMPLEHGADINARTKGNRTPLFMAAELGSVEVV